ncbi:putative cytochrome P450 [Cryphonectria parasitica EP155]|uniref:Cytochrome P450 n=1 Tax=Cryphonectria parasitica (strain ATCC 38755 / EP155) TaxID=660469 RepID=A0A9P5CP10_CRYP1|nr:putative cytochrome P450 [Cryphonectria parasitica EP155]KAF3765693.1 putative cytochrome P450 [Cryphonectria parasitica EP155]
MDVHSLASVLPEGFRAFYARNAYIVGASEADYPTIWVVLLLAAAGVGVLWLSSTQSTKAKQPPCLSETIPRVTNIYHWWTNMKKFLVRVEEALQNSSVIKFYLGPTTAYVVRGAANVQEIFRTSSTSKFESDIMIEMVAARQWGMPKKDLDKIKRDKSGRSKKPLPGTEDLPEQDRFFYAQHHIYSEYLAHLRSSTGLAEVFYKFVTDKLDAEPVGAWKTVSLVGFCRMEVAEAAIRTLLGSQVVDNHPDFLDAFWKWEADAVLLFFGVPRWLNSRPYDARERLNRIMKDYMRLADQFDFDGPDSEVVWEERSGSRVAREMLKYYRGTDFDDEGIAGYYATFLLAQNSNTLPIATWVVMEAAQDPALLQALQKEVDQVFAEDHTLVIPKLLALPLLQSVYTEALRLHMSFNLPRTTRDKVVMDGYEIRKGTLVLAPIEIAHLDEAVWGSPGHPASEFWAERHLKYTETVDKDTGQKTMRPEFSMAKNANMFFPYGGGSGICPGRTFAKQEILMIAAILLAKFDFEFLEWTKLDGTKSDRPAQDDERYTGMAAMPPDRDMKVRLKRRW